MVRFRRLAVQFIDDAVTATWQVQAGRLMYPSGTMRCPMLAGALLHLASSEVIGWRLNYPNGCWAVAAAIAGVLGSVLTDRCFLWRAAIAAKSTVNFRADGDCADGVECQYMVFTL